MHVCCGPCLIFPLKTLRMSGLHVDGYFYNPNIQPYTEFKRRLECLEGYAKAEGMNLISEVGYDIEEFFRKVAGHEPERCAICYEMRLRKTAQAASAAGYDAFTTTLLYSKYQKHDLIVQVADVLAREIGVEFLYRDFRIGWQEGQEKSREIGMYRQKYCGCVYSEKERYYKLKMPER
jgi:predicted adenine nucleotide alpha hydrolase (AANH) superfamily ATPase